MADKKLNIDVTIRKRTSGSSGAADDPKIVLEREKQAGKERLANLKGEIAEKQKLLEQDINKNQARLTQAYAKELDAVKTGNRLKIKDAIQTRKEIESVLRQLEASHRGSISKEVEAFRTGEMQKRAEFRKSIQEFNNAPKTNLRGAIGSESYVRQLQSAQSKMLPGSQDFVQTGVLINKYKADLKSAGVEVQSLSQKIGGEFKGAISSTVTAMQPYLISMISIAGAQKLWQLSLDSKKLEVLRSHFVGSADDLNKLKIASAQTVEEASLIKLSNQAFDLGVNLQKQTIIMSIAEDVADKYGGSVEENFLAIVNSTEGATKVLKTLGIQKKVYEETLKSLAKEQGLELDKLTAEEEKRLRLDAVIKISNVTYDQAITKVQDAADEQESLGVVLGDLWSKFGYGTVKVLLPFIASLEDAARGVHYLINNFKLLGKGITDKFADDLNIITLGLIDLRREAETPIRVQFEVGGLENVYSAWSQIKDMMTDNFSGDLRDASYWTGLSIEELEKIARSKGLIGLGKDTEAMSPSKSKGPTSGRTGKKEKEEELNLIKEQEKALAKLKLQLAANLGDIGAELDLKKQILAVELEIIRLRTGQTPSTSVGTGGTMAMAVRLAGKGMFKTPDLNLERGEPEWRARLQEADEIAEKQMGYAKQMEGSFFSMLQNTGLMESDFGSIVQMIKSIIDTGFDAVGLIGGIIGFFSNPVGSTIGGIGGGGRATGGHVSKNVPYVIGEKGREYFYPLTDGMVIPNHLLGLFNMIEQGRRSSDANYYATGGFMPKIGGGGDIQVNVDLAIKKYFEYSVTKKGLSEIGNRS